MATTRDFIVRFLGDNKDAVAKLDKFQTKIEKTTSAGGKAFSGFAGIASGALAAIGVSNILGSVTDFVSESVGAFKEAQLAQAGLEDAYKRFPATADVTIGTLRNLNTELQRKTGFDDDATASAQGVLAGFQLTGSQIEKLTPLLQDYAAKTGKDLPTAAEDLGKAILGQGRALKGIGIEFQDTGTTAGNFDQLMGGLTEKVGGFAENEGKTAAGTAKIMEAQMGDLQEMIGEKVLPVVVAFQSFVIDKLIPAIMGVVDWVSQNIDWLQPLAIGLGIVAAAVLLLNVALWVLSINPITLILIAILVVIGLLIGAVILLVTHWNQVVAWMTDVWNGFVTWFIDVMNGFLAWWNGMWAGFGGFITDVWNGFIGFITDVWTGFIGMIMGLGQGLSDWWAGLWAGFGGFVEDAFMNVVNFVIGGINGVIDIVNGAIDLVNGLGETASNISGGLISWKVDKFPHIPALALGGVTNGPMLAIVGDNPGGREVVEPLSSYKAQMAAERAAGAREAQYAPPVLEFHGSGSALADLFEIYERKADGRRVLVKKMGKQS